MKPLTPEITAARASTRAYLFVPKLELMFRNAVLLATISIGHAGQTPAFNTVVALDVATAEGEKLATQQETIGIVSGPRSVRFDTPFSDTKLGRILITARLKYQDFLSISDEAAGIWECRNALLTPSHAIPVDGLRTVTNLTTLERLVTPDVNSTPTSRPT